MPDNAAQDPQDPTTQPDTAASVQPAQPEGDESKKDEVSYLQRLRNSNFQQVADNARKEDEKIEKTEAAKSGETKTGEQDSENKTQVDLAALKAKETAEIAAKTASEIIERQEKARAEREEAEVKRKEAAAKAEQEQSSRAEQIKPHYTGRDAKGNIVPKNYEEVNNEAVRIARLQAKWDDEDREAARQTQSEKAAQAKKEEDDRLHAARETSNKQLSAVIAEETEELFRSGKLPKIVNPADPNDPGNVALNELLKQGAELNERRAKEGKPVITSLTRIFTSYYKPPKAPVSTTAPVQGAMTSQAAPAEDGKNYNFNKYHRMGLSDFLTDIAKRRQRQEAK